MQFVDNAGSDQPAPALFTYRISGCCSICRRTENVQIRLHGCARSPVPSQFADDILAFFPTLTTYGIILGLPVITSLNFGIQILLCMSYILG